MLTKLRHLLELIRFSHTLFALPFALLGAMMAWRVNSYENQLQNWVADVDEKMRRATPILSIGDSSSEEYILLGGSPVPFSTSWRWQEISGILMCMVAARSAAMAFNRLADRKIDALNPRTATRHIPAGILSAGSVGMFAAMSSAAFVASTLMFLPNRLPLFLSVPVLLFLLGYSYAKRFTSLAHVWLGAGLAMAPIAAWIAIRGEVVLVNPADLLPVMVLGGAVLCWVAGFDIIYACQDADFDRKANLHSIPAHWGVPAALQFSALLHGATVTLLALVPVVYPFFGWLWWCGVAAVAGLLIYEHRLVRPDDLNRVNVAFFNVNIVVSLGLLAVGVIDLWVV